MKSAVQIAIADFGSKDQKDSIVLRRQVLRFPLWLDFSKEELEGESDQIHFVAKLGNTIVGVLLFHPESKTCLKMRQVAVDPKKQNQGIGKALVQASEVWAREHNYSEIFLHAREPSVAFYKSRGYSVEGGAFTEVGIPHNRMKKTLK